MYVENRLTLFINRGALFYLVCVPCITGLILFVIVHTLYEKRITATSMATASPVQVHYVFKKNHHVADREVTEHFSSEHASSESEQADIVAGYIRYILSKIKSHKIYPETERALSHQGVVGMQLLLYRSGRVKKLVITQQPEFPGFLQSAVRAVKSSLPFKPFPALLEQDLMQIDFKIRFALQ
jgi:outer membrane biosynthesis protein TonB